MPIDLSEVALDPDNGLEFCIIRNPGTFSAGGWVAGKPCQGPAFGIIEIASAEALQQVPEGDRVDGSIQIITAQPIYETLARRSATSDTVLWCGNYYRVQSVKPWKMNGYWSAILVRKTGD